jgi:ubiquinone/menaquinone biosynthesis C-methylase UbiE
LESNQKKEQLDYYGKGSGDYEKTRLFLTRGLNRASKRKADTIISELGSCKSVLEVGAGSGFVSCSIVENLNAHKYVLMDLSKQMLETAKSRISNKHVSFVCGDVTNTKYKANEFDAVTGTDIIHHLENPAAAMAEWLRITKAGGKLVFLETNALNPLIFLNIGVEHEVRCFLNTPGNLEKWLNEAGWSNVKVSPSKSFTPSGPKWLSPVLNVIDAIAWKIPYLSRISAQWLLTAEKK